MSMKQTDTKEISLNTFATQIIQKSNQLDLQLIERNDMIERLKVFLVANPEADKQIMSGLIEKLSLIDPDFAIYKR